MNFCEEDVSTKSIKKCRRDSLSMIPTDLVMEIFSRLPVKSVGRCRCLSKLWNEVICGPYFIDLFAAKSSARPQILFVEIVRDETPGISFFSSHQPYENSDDDKIALTHRTHHPISFISCDIGVPINGLVCLSILTEYVDKIRVVVIYNPNTGEFLTLPKVETRQEYPDIKFFLVYDPTENQFKVMSLVYREFREWLPEHRVLTLENKEVELSSWRMIECCKPHFPIDGSEICINGVLYYLDTWILNVEELIRSGTRIINEEEFIVCFDVRSETFRFMKTMETPNQKLPSSTVFTKYDGKLGLLVPGDADNFIIGQSTSFELWVLTGKHEWCKHRYVLPPAWKNVVGKTMLDFVGMIGTKEIVYRSRYDHGPPDILCHNIEKNTIRRLTIQGIEPSTPTNVDVVVFLDHVDSLSLTRTLKL